MNKKLTISIISILVIIGVVFTIFMITSSQKSTYYGYMSDSTTAEKVVSEKDHKVEENVKIPSKSGFNPKKGDFVKLIKSEGEDTYSKMEVVDHDDIPHGLMMKIHDMDMKGM